MLRVTKANTQDVLSLHGVNLPSYCMLAIAKMLFNASSSIGSSKDTPVSVSFGFRAWIQFVDL